MYRNVNSNTNTRWMHTCTHSVHGCQGRYLARLNYSFSVPVSVPTPPALHWGWGLGSRWGRPPWRWRWPRWWSRSRNRRLPDQRRRTCGVGQPTWSGWRRWPRAPWRQGEGGAGGGGVEALAPAPPRPPGTRRTTASRPRGLGSHGDLGVCHLHGAGTRL